MFDTTTVLRESPEMSREEELMHRILDGELEFDQIEKEDVPNVLKAMSEFAMDLEKDGTIESSEDFRFFMFHLIDGILEL